MSKQALKIDKENEMSGSLGKNEGGKEFRTAKRKVKKPRGSVKMKRGSIRSSAREMRKKMNKKMRERS
jgi:hypothetical protein